MSTVYYLVLLHPGEAASDADLDARHETFIDDLIRRNEILLGGNLLPREDPPAAYLLVTDSRAQAEEVVGDDPYVRADVFRPRILEWRLVAINPEAVDERLVLRPHDVGEEPETVGLRQSSTGGSPSNPRQDERASRPSR